MATAGARASKLWVSVAAKRGSTTLVSPTVLEASDEYTYGSLLEKLSEVGKVGGLELQSKTLGKVTISGPETTAEKLVVPLNAPVIMVSLY